MLDYYILERSNYILEVMIKTKEDKMNDINARQERMRATKPQERLRRRLTLGWLPGGGGGGDTPLYKPYRYVPPQREYFLRRFGLESGF